MVRARRPKTTASFFDRFNGGFRPLLYKSRMSTLEYGIIAACILIAIITVLNALGTKLKATMATFTAIQREASQTAERRRQFVLEEAQHCDHPV